MSEGKYGFYVEDGNLRCRGRSILYVGLHELADQLNLIEASHVEERVKEAVERCAKIVKEAGPTPNPLDLIAAIRALKPVMDKPPPHRRYGCNVHPDVEMCNCPELAPPKESPRIPGLDKPEEGLLSMKDEGPSHYIHADGCFYLVHDTSELGRLSALNFIKVVNDLHASIVKPLREKAESLEKELDDLASGFPCEKCQEREKDRDAWKEKPETLAAHHERMMGLPSPWKEDADRLASALEMLKSEAWTAPIQQLMYASNPCVRKANEALVNHENIVGGSKKDG